MKLATPMDDKTLQEKIRKDLSSLPNGRWYPTGVPTRLRSYLTKNMPDVEIAPSPNGKGETVRIKAE